MSYLLIFMCTNSFKFQGLAHPLRYLSGQVKYALSTGIFFCNVHVCVNGLPQYFSLINTVYAH